MSKKVTTKSRGGQTGVKKARAKPSPKGEALKASSSGVQRRAEGPVSPPEPKRTLLEVKPAPKNEPLRDSDGPFRVGMEVFDFDEPVYVVPEPEVEASREQPARSQEAMKKGAEFVKRVKGLSGAG